MALNFTPIQYDGEFTSLQKSHLKTALTSISNGASLTPQTATGALTDSTGGTPSATLAAITVTTPADLTAVGVQLGIIRNAIASEATKINALRTELIASGILTA